MATESIFTLRQAKAEPANYKYFYVIENTGPCINVYFMYGIDSPVSIYTESLSEISATIEFTVQPCLCVSTTLDITLSQDGVKPTIKINNFGHTYVVNAQNFFPYDIGCTYGTYPTPNFNQDINLLSGSSGVVDGKSYKTIIYNRL